MWNCRGLGNPQAVLALKGLIHSKAPDVVFAMETKMYTSEVLKNRGMGGLPNVFPVQCAGSGRSRASGLFLMWSSEVEVDILSASLNHIAFSLVHPDHHDPMHMLAVYGFPEEQNKVRTWQLVKSICPQGRDVPWLCFGDFNDILSPTDKLGGDPPNYAHMQEVMATCSTCDLHDVGFSGYRFTWSNKRAVPGTVEERLDYALANDAWDALWPVTEVTHLPRYRSDHNPLLICCGSRGMRKELQRTSMFRFEELWLQEEECKELVTEAWGEGSAMGLTAKLSSLGSSLKDWGREKFGDIPKKISDTKALLQKLQRQTQSEQVVRETKEAEIALDTLLMQ
ncbi:uncharacterized protein LOC130710871 [Lotus japonicus]|uniref:uncharacterized protein LOC130710871 n=1 Tax=Lotus japonicus TaxID=34305 RepID=UPI002585327C|nr:uncharacterized protein LOC130710871 [Lotus japonicus]